MILNTRETATVLAALRHFQTLDSDAMHGEHFTDVQPLNAKQIDKLCERINTEDSIPVLRKPVGKSWEKHVNEDGYLTKVVPVDFDFLLECDIEALDDFLDDVILGPESGVSLSDISWKVVGTSKSGQILLSVTGNPV